MPACRQLCCAAFPFQYKQSVDSGGREDVNVVLSHDHFRLCLHICIVIVQVSVFLTISWHVFLAPQQTARGLSQSKSPERLGEVSPEKMGGRFSRREGS